MKYILLSVLFGILSGCVSEGDELPSDLHSSPETGVVMTRAEPVCPELESSSQTDEELASDTVSTVSSESLQESLVSLSEVAPLSSIVIQHRGEIVASHYFGSMRAGRFHNVKSVSKSILSILTGIAIDQGYLEGTDQQIGEFFPDWFERNPDPEKEAITIRNLLTMRSGLGSTSGRNYGAWVLSRNWVHHALNRPLSGRPGIDRIYSTGNTHLLGVIIARASGKSLRAFADQYLFGPMEIQPGGWDRDPQGNYMGGNNLALKPEDMIKIGQLMMNVGAWNGKQLISSEWVIESVQPYTGRDGRMNYGYLWFRRKAAGYDVVHAWGNGGQFIKIVPALELVIAITSWEGGGASRSDRFNLYEQLDSEIISRFASQREM